MASMGPNGCLPVALSSGGTCQYEMSFDWPWKGAKSPRLVRSDEKFRRTAMDFE